MNTKYNITKHVSLSNDAIEYQISDGEFESRFRLTRYYEIQIPDLEQYLIDQHERLKVDSPTYRHTGPTNEQLDRYPALKEAWSNFRIIQKICGGK